MNWLDGFSDQSDLIQGYSTERFDYHPFERSPCKSIFFPAFRWKFWYRCPNEDREDLKYPLNRMFFFGVLCLCVELAKISTAIFPYY